MAVVFKPSSAPKPSTATSKSNAQQEVAKWMKVSAVVVDGLVDRLKPGTKPTKKSAS